jgi:hypothetical protein
MKYLAISFFDEFLHFIVMKEISCSHRSSFKEPPEYSGQHHRLHFRRSLWFCSLPFFWATLLLPFIIVPFHVRQAKRSGQPVNKQFMPHLCSGGGRGSEYSTGRRPDISWSLSGILCHCSTWSPFAAPFRPLSPHGIAVLATLKMKSLPRFQFQKNHAFALETIITSKPLDLVYQIDM